jgi:hypothetical protein
MWNEDLLNRPPQRGRRARVVVVLLAVLFLLVAGLLAGTVALRRHPTVVGGVAEPTTTPSSEPSATVSPTKPLDFDGDLVSLLIVPGGTAVDVTGSDGSRTLEQAANDYQDSAAGGEHLQRLGYLRGATSSWRLFDDLLIRVTLDQFAHEGGGVYLYASELKSQRQNEPGLDGQAVVEGIDYSRWFRYLPDNRAGDGCD